MTYQQTKYILVLLISSIIWGCTNEDNPSESTLIKHYKKTSTEVASIRAFTKDGEILDKNAEQIFLKQNQGYNNIFEETPFENLNIRLFEETALITSDDHIAEYNYTQEGDFMRFRSLDTTSVAVFGSQDLISDHLIAHQPLYIKKEADPSGIFTDVTTVPEMYAQVKSDTIKFPTLYYFWHKKSSNNSVLVSGFKNNELNESFYSEIPQGDTIFVKQDWVILQ